MDIGWLVNDNKSEFAIIAKIVKIEYVLTGTLLSFDIATLCGLMVRYFYSMI